MGCDVIYFSRAVISISGRVVGDRRNAISRDLEKRCKDYYSAAESSNNYFSIVKLLEFSCTVIVT